MVPGVAGQRGAVELVTDTVHPAAHRDLHNNHAGQNSQCGPMRQVVRRPDLIDAMHRDRRGSCHKGDRADDARERFGFAVAVRVTSVGRAGGDLQATPDDE